jgi:Flp pilus assembly protein TadG
MSLRRLRGQRGQSLVEASLGLSLLLVMIVGTVDLGRTVYQYNSAAEAARAIARATSVHPGSDGLGNSSETAAVLATQQGLVPSLVASSYECLDIAGAQVTGDCHPGNWVRVTVTSSYDPALPLLMPFAPFILTSSASAEIQ